MSKCSAKNRRCAGGDEWCIGGTLRIEDGATLDVAEGATVNGLAAGGGGGGSVYYVCWSDAVGQYILYKDKDHTEGVTSSDLNDVLSAKFCENEGEYLVCSGVSVSEEGGFVVYVMFAQDPENIAIKKVRSVDYVESGPQ